MCKRNHYRLLSEKKKKKQFTIPALDYRLTGNLRGAKMHTVYRTLAGQAGEVQRWGGAQLCTEKRKEIMNT